MGLDQYAYVAMKNNEWDEYWQAREENSVLSKLHELDSAW